MCIKIHKIKTLCFKDLKLMLYYFSQMFFIVLICYLDFCLYLIKKNTWQIIIKWKKIKKRYNLTKNLQKKLQSKQWDEKFFYNIILTKEFKTRLKEH